MDCHNDIRDVLNCYFDRTVFRYQMGSEKWYQRSL